MLHVKLRAHSGIAVSISDAACARLAVCAIFVYILLGCTFLVRNSSVFSCGVRLSNFCKRVYSSIFSHFIHQPSHENNETCLLLLCTRTTENFHSLLRTSKMSASYRFKKISIIYYILTKMTQTIENVGHLSRICIVPTPRNVDGFAAQQRRSTVNRQR